MNERKQHFKIAVMGAIAILAVLGIFSIFNHPSTAMAAAQSSLTIQEDDPQFDCQTMGNRICGPSNTNGATPGIYASNGKLIATWDVWLANLNKIDRESKKAH